MTVPRAAGLVVLLAIAVTVIVMAQKPVSVTDFQFTAASNSQIDAAIAYAQSQIGHTTGPGKASWNGNCLLFISTAWNAGGITIGSSASALSYWNSDPEGYTKHSESSYSVVPPKGALVFWSDNQWTPNIDKGDGHVAISLGNGSVISTPAYPYGANVNAVFPFVLTKRPAGPYHYLGYMMPMDKVAVVPSHPAPPAATLVPVATPKPATPSTVTKDGAPVTSSAKSATITTKAVAVATPRPAPATPVPTPRPVATPVPTPVPPTTYAETVGGISNTWTNYSNAGGNEGPQIVSNRTVQITCKLTGFKVADGNTWWYRIASSPWNNNYYVSADAFYNNGQTSGSLHGTPFVDTKVPNC